MASDREPIIKICGLRSAEVVQVALAAGASALGFMFAPSKRRISPEEVAVMLSIGESEPRQSVAVVVNEDARTLADWRVASGVDTVQLSGDESPEILGQLDGTMWKALRFSSGTSLDEARAETDLWVSGPNAVEYVLVDAAVSGQYGGTGHKADWELVAELSQEYPVILAGGLSPANVGEAIRTVRPAGVDVSSGVERNGQKDSRLVQEFLAEARAAYGLDPVSLGTPANQSSST